MIALKYKLPVNPKKHYMYDMLYHLTRGQARAEGHAQVTVVAEVDPFLCNQSCSFVLLLLHHPAVMSFFTSSPLKHDREELLRKLFRCGHNMSQMANSANKQVVEAPASTSATGNGVFVAKPAEEAEVLSSIKSNVKGKPAARPLDPDRMMTLRPLRSTCLSNDLAVSWQVCGREISR